jgi:hypothetical protein
MAKRVKPGDVLELNAPDGWIYVHYLGRHPVYGDAMTVCPTVNSTRAKADQDLFRDGYVTFYPVAAAVRQGLAAIIGHLPSPGLPRRFRRAGVRSGRTIETWIIEGEGFRVVRKRLSDTERRLPIAAIWNHEFLVQRVSKGWRPEMEGVELKDHQDESREPSQDARLSVVCHYLYFPRESAASQAAAKLRAEGFEVETRLAADGANWLTLAKHRVVSEGESLAATRETMEQLVHRLGGEYDGWEAEVQN